jgi:hypothetical protein
MIKDIINSVRPKIWAWLIIATFLLLVSKCVSAQNIGFEAGNLSNWTTSENDAIVSIRLNNVSYGSGITWKTAGHNYY